MNTDIVFDAVGVGCFGIGHVPGGVTGWVAPVGVTGWVVPGHVYGWDGRFIRRVAGRFERRWRRTVVIIVVRQGVVLIIDARVICSSRD